jgi:hypothetical protein
MKIRCSKCGEAWEIKGQPSFRDECPECAAYIHTCSHCAHFDAPTRGCRLPQVEEVHDRQGQNFCEEFEFGPNTPGGPGATPPAKAPKPVTPDEARRRFEDLFKDPGKS